MSREIVVMKKPIRPAAAVFRQKLKFAIKQVGEETLAALNPLRDVFGRRRRRRLDAMAEGEN